MDLRTRLPMAARLARVRLTRERLPVAARFVLTEACPSRCEYCSYGVRAPGELDTARWRGLIHAAGRLGVRRLCLSGGEPCLRSDLMELVRFTSDEGIEPELNTSGAAFDRHEGLAGALSLLKVSLDGPPEVHDRARGRAGSHNEAVAAARGGVDAGTRTVLVATVTDANVDVLEYVAKLAASIGALACFQPLRDWGFLRTPDARHPSRDRYEAAMDRLVAGMDDGRWRLRHSRAGLRHARSSPDFPEVACWAGRVFFIVMANGDLVACDRTNGAGPRVPIQGNDIARALAAVGEITCTGCAFSGATELNLLMAGRAGVASRLVALAGAAR